MTTYLIVGLVVCAIYQNKFIAPSENPSAAKVAGNIIGAAIITAIWPMALIKIVSSK